MTTIKDIAKAAGVSVTTVSRALNGYSDVSEKTRKKIEEIAKELKYSPNTLARSLVMNKSKTIGLLVSGIKRESIKDNFVFEVLVGLNEYVGETDYDLVLFSTTSSKQSEKSYSQLCRERRVDGVIIQGIRTDDPYLREIVDSEIPCVLIDIPIQSESVGYVTTDNVLGARTAVKHLVKSGHRNIAMINGHEFAFVSRQRLEGYFQALEGSGISINPDWVVNGYFNETQAKEVALNLLQKSPEITGIFCASDLMAIGAIKAAKELNLRVPEDLSIVGYDDIILAEQITPPLTTIAQDKVQMGYQAAKLLINMLENDHEPNVITLPTVLKVRESTTTVNK
jgi:LacI family transcriptional regulator